VLQRPIGFSPSEISALVNEDVVSQHAEEAAFLWTLRTRAAREPHYSLSDLARLDERVEAHVDGLRTSREVGWQYCKKNLQNRGPGEVFALSVLAFGAGDRAGMTEVLSVATESPKTTGGLLSALGWLDFDVVLPWLSRLLEAKSPAHRAVGVRAAAIHRRDPGPILAEALSSEHPVLRASALRAAGELKRRDLGGLVRRHLTADDEVSRFWAAWALTLHGDPAGRFALTKWFGRADGFSRRALQLAIRAMPLDESREWVKSLARQPGLSSAAIVAAAALGDPDAIPWLIRSMESPQVARLAGEAFTTITGLDLSYADLTQDAPTERSADTSVQEVLDLDYESNLPWPSPARIKRWWDANASRFSAGVRYLAGKPIELNTMRQVLSSEKQRQRAAAALELGLQQLDEVLFEVRGRADRQQRDLAG